MRYQEYQGPNFEVPTSPQALGLDSFCFSVDSVVDDSQFLSFGSDISSPRSLDTGSTISSEDSLDQDFLLSQRMDSFQQSISQAPYVSPGYIPGHDVDDGTQGFGGSPSYIFEEPFYNASQYLAAPVSWVYEQDNSPNAVGDGDLPFFDASHSSLALSPEDIAATQYGDSNAGVRAPKKGMPRQNLHPARPVLLPRAPVSEQLRQPHQQADLKSGGTPAPMPLSSTSLGVVAQFGNGSQLDNRTASSKANANLLSSMERSVSNNGTEGRSRSTKRSESIASGDGGESEEEENARTDYRYAMSPADDGLYYCPQSSDQKEERIFPDDSKCEHKGMKLKCDYDKCLDSHLKPYRCKFEQCTELKFSSTACRLRHEREAHGSHGHGIKPNLCIFPECERSKPGHGFPRQWNCFDHMRRCHNYQAPPAAPTASPKVDKAATSPAAPPKARSSALRRKRSAPEDPRPRKRHPVDTSAAADVGPISLCATPLHAPSSVVSADSTAHPDAERSEAGKWADSSKWAEAPAELTAKGTEADQLRHEWRLRHRRMHYSVHRLSSFGDVALLRIISEDAGRMTAISEQLEGDVRARAS